ncbi:MAG: hypothetical protein ACPMAQ_02135 [Phycisphaerae bacterium]
MAWFVGAIAALCAAGLLIRRRRLRERARCSVHVRQLRSMLERALRGDIEPLRRHAHECHERGPARAAAEAWYVLGCALLDLQRPEEATRAFQLSCHAHPGLGAAVLLAFTCLKTRSPDMPGFVRILLDTYRETGSHPIPAGAWERQVHRILHTPDLSLAGLSPLARSLMCLPVRCIRTHVRAAVESAADWAGPLLKTPGARREPTAHPAGADVRGPLSP